MKLGTAFSDSLSVGQNRPSRLLRAEAPSWWFGAGRALLFASVFFLSFFILALRLANLTLVRGHELRLLADENRTRELIRHAPRGIIFDRTGQPLVANVPQYRLNKPCEGAGSANTTCVSVVSGAEGTSLSSRVLPPGTFLEVDYARTYLFGNALAHVLGYTGELSAAELSDPYYSLRRYLPGDRVGRSGAEEVYEEKLRGTDGRQLVEVDANGKILRTLGMDPETPGDSITLSVDGGLAQAVADAFPKGEKGAVIVSKPSTGEILALYSSPSFDPNSFSAGMTASEYAGLVDTPDQPLFDRAVSGVYPPGSTFKIVMAIAGLETGAVKPDTVVDDNGTITIGPFSFSNWYFTQYGKTEGPIAIVRAIARSNDIFFYKVGEWLGISRLETWAKKLGIGAPLGIELPGEAGGLFPDPVWKNLNFTSPADRAARNNLWYLGDTYHVSIGQGYLLTTPLQMNAWTNVIANGGKLCRPTILKETGDRRPETGGCKDLGIKPETIRLITEGMKEACETGGTGWPLFNFHIPARIASQSDAGGGPKPNDQTAGTGSSSASATLIPMPVACKTGTAEHGDPDNKTHAWFTAFAPLPPEYLSEERATDPRTMAGTPEISVTVLVEDGGEGSNVAAPIAKKIFEYWFRR
ncbi:penicillin-binding transpeptidase domain-containing protein [Patescibacteria group bacterium]|nr:penicillin-binding transpeptidase domain-containing protein [Patescibacteria group bacterium]